MSENPLRFQWTRPVRTEAEVAPGDFRFVHDEDGNPSRSRLAFVCEIKKRAGKAEAVLIALTTTERAATTQHDVAIVEQESGLAFPVWIQTDVFGWVRAEQIDEGRWGRVSGGLYERVRESFVSKSALHRFRREGRTGVVLAASDDVRWHHKQAATVALMRLASGWRLATLNDTPRSEKDDISTKAGEPLMNQWLVQLTSDDPAVRQAAARGLADLARLNELAIQGAERQ